MKKLLAILTVMCMVLTTLVVPTVAFGTENEIEESNGGSSSESTVIEFYSKASCEEEDWIYQIHANKSEAAEKTCFYVKYPKGKTLQHKVGSRHMLKIGEDSEGKGGVDYTVWRMESPNTSVTYYNYDTFNESEIKTPYPDGVLIDAFEDEFDNGFENCPVDVHSVLNYVTIEEDIVADAGYSVAKVSLAGYDDDDDGTIDSEFRGSEDFLFMFSVDGAWENAASLEVNYGIEIKYNLNAINEIDTASTAFYRLCNIDTDSEVVGIEEADGYRSVLLSYLGSLSTGREDLRHGVGSDFWVDLNAGYQITGIYDVSDDNNKVALPYTASLRSYFEVYDENGKKVKIEELEKVLGEDCWWGAATIGGSPEEGKEDETIASAYTTTQTLAKGGVGNLWSNSDDSWNGFEPGIEDTSDFYAWCKEYNYTAELMGTHLIYQIFMPVENQCKIEVETADASSINSFNNTDENSNTNVKYSGDITNFTSRKVELKDDKASVNESLKAYYGDEVEVIDVYEFTGDVNGVANVAIPVENSNKYEVVWLSEVSKTDDEGNVISSELAPVPMLSVDTADNNAKVIPTGHFSKYAVVGKQPASNDSSGGNETPDTSGGPGTAAPTPDKAVDTGDDFNMAPYIAVMVIALAGVAAAMFRRRTVK